MDGCTFPNGSGAAAHGTIDDWVRSLSAAGKTANLVSAGYVASGFVYDGVLRSATFGPNQYLFTNSAKSKVTATAAAKHATVKKGNKVVIKGKATPVGPGAKVTLEVKKKTAPGRRSRPRTSPRPATSSSRPRPARPARRSTA